MEVFMRLNNFDIFAEDIVLGEDKNIPKDIMSMLFGYIKMGYKVAAHDEELYLRDGFDDGQFLFGLTEPEKLIKRALAWNGEIKTALFESMLAVLSEAEANAKRDGLGIDNGLVLDTKKTYVLSCAAREADDHWYYYADHAVLLPDSAGYTDFRTVLPEEYLRDIQENPQDYVVVTVYPK